MLRTKVIDRYILWPIVARRVLYAICMWSLAATGLRPAWCRSPGSASA